MRGTIDQDPLPASSHVNKFFGVLGLNVVLRGDYLKIVSFATGIVLRKNTAINLHHTNFFRVLTKWASFKPTRTN